MMIKTNISILFQIIRIFSKYPIPNQMNCLTRSIKTKVLSKKNINRRFNSDIIFSIFLKSIYFNLLLNSIKFLNFIYFL